MSELEWTDERGMPEYFEWGLEGLLNLYGNNPPRDATSVWRLHGGDYHKVIQGEIIEEVESPPMLERGKMAVSSEEGRDSGTAHGAGAGNASNISLPVPVLRGLAPDEAGAKNE